MKRTKHISNVIVQSNTGYTIRTEMLDGKKHLVVPVVMMVEGVHSGSGGAILHLADELGRIPASWNGIPVTISHPQEKDEEDVNVFVSANSPEQIQQAVGRVFNTHMEDGKLKAEAWIDENKISSLSATTLAFIRAGSPIDVSVGIFTDNEIEEGDWNGEQYVAIAHNYRPDHLALLPNEEGACSWKDGCGIRVNSTNKNKNEMKNLDIYKKLNEQKLAVVPVVNSINLDSLSQAIYNTVNTMDNDLRVYYVEAVYADFYIFRVRNRANGDTKIYRQNFTTEGDGENIKLKIDSDPIEVQKTITYDTLQKKPQRTIFNNNSKTQNNMDVTNVVNGLIANTKTHFTECDRQWLSALSADALAKLEPKEEKKDPITLDANSAYSFLKSNPPKTEDVLQLLSKEEKANYEKGLATYNKQRKELVDSIIANSEMKEDELKDMSSDVLEKFAKSLKPADFSGQSAGGIETNTTSDEDFLPLAGYGEISK